MIYGNVIYLFIFIYLQTLTLGMPNRALAPLQGPFTVISFS